MTDDTKVILAEITRAHDLTRHALTMVVAQNDLLRSMVDALCAVREAYQETSEALDAIHERMEGPEAERAPPGPARPFRARTPRNLN